MVGFLLFFRVDGLGNLHQDELPLAAVFGVQPHHGFGGGAGTGEEIQGNAIGVVGRDIANQFCNFIGVFRIVEDVLFVKQFAECPHRNLRLFVKITSSHLCGKFFFAVRFVFKAIKFLILRNGANVGFAKWGLGVVCPKCHQPQINLAFHFLIIGINPTPFWYFASLLCGFMGNVVAGAATAGPRDVAVAPRPVFVYPFVTAPFFGWVASGQFTEPCLQIEFNFTVIVAMVLAQFQILVPNFTRTGFLFAPKRLVLSQVGLRLGVNQQVLMSIREKFGVVLSPFFPGQTRDEILLPKNLIAQQLQLRLFVVVNRNEDHAIVAQQVFGQQQARVHEREPAAVGAGAVDVFDVVDVVRGVPQLSEHLALAGGEVVAVNEGVVLGVVRRVDVDQLDLAEIAVAQQAQGVEVVALDEQVAGAVPMLAVLRQWVHDFLRRHKGAVVRLALAHPAQLKAVFFHPNASRVGGVQRLLQRGGVDAHAAIGRGLDGLGKQLAQQFELVCGGAGGGEKGMVGHGRNGWDGTGRWIQKWMTVSL